MFPTLARRRTRLADKTAQIAGLVALLLLASFVLWNRAEHRAERRALDLADARATDALRYATELRSQLSLGPEEIAADLARATAHSRSPGASRPVRPTYSVYPPP